MQQDSAARIAQLHADGWPADTRQADFRFGRFELQSNERRLLLDGEPVVLGPRAFDLLAVLVERAGHLISKEELLERVWPKLVVEEANLQVQISTLRKVLGAVAIATVTGKGYRFTLEVERATEGASSRSARRHNLPQQLTSFVGRERESAQIKKLLSDARLLTLVGAGGVGKTRLALQVAADTVDDFEHGVSFVPLAALSNPENVLPTIAKAFEVREARGRPLQAELEDYLREKHMLLVLDNFEQVIEAAPLVLDLLRTAPRLRVLVTSREVLRLSGETDYLVCPLSLPDPKQLSASEEMTRCEAVALFIERARAVKPAFVVTDANAPIIADLCRRLDGLPLAIELAATHTRVLSPQRMLVELSRRLDFLVGGARDLPPRQSTLRGTIDWSHNSLTRAERKLFRRLAVFVGGNTLEAIEAVSNSETESNVIGTIESLVSKSVVNEIGAYGEPRFAMLETIREYATEKLLASGEEELIRERHRAYYLALADKANLELRGAEQTAWLRCLEDEHENLRAALKWSLQPAGSEGGLRLCGALQRFWVTRGYFSEGRAWCVRFLAECEVRTTARANALNTAGVLARFQADYAVARAWHEESLAIRRQLGDRSGIAGSLNNLASVFSEQTDYSSARSLYEESLAIMRELGHRAGIADSLINLGIVFTEQGDYAGARVLHEESLLIRRELDDVEGTAVSLEGLADLVAAVGNSLRAARIWGAAERLRAEVGSPLSPRVRPNYVRRVAAARAALADDTAFELGWQEGRALTTDQAIELALQKLED